MANKTIATLSVALAAKTDKLRKGLGKSQAMLKRFGGVASKLAKVGLAAVAAAALAAAAAIAKLTAAGLKNINTMRKMASKLGISVDEMRALKQLAKNTGVEIDAVEGAIEELNIRVGEALVSNTGAAADAFKELGINVDRLAEKDPAQQFAEIGDALQQVDGQRRDFLADEIFGGDASEIRRVLEAGSEGLRLAAGEAKKLGGNLSEIDTENVRKVQQQAKKIVGRLQTIGNQLAAELSPLILKVFEFVNKFLPTGKDIENGVKDILNLGAAAFGIGKKLVDIVVAVGKGIQSMVLARVTAVGTALVGIIDFIRGALNKTPSFIPIPGKKELQSSLDTASSGIENLVKKTKKGAIESAGAFVAEFKDPLSEGFAEAVDKSTSDLDAFLRKQANDTQEELNKQKQEEKERQQAQQAADKARRAQLKKEQQRKKKEQEEKKRRDMAEQKLLDRVEKTNEIQRKILDTMPRTTNILELSQIMRQLSQRPI